MNSYIKVSTNIFATLGAPNGFQQKDKSFPSLDLNTKAIRIAPKSPIYSLDKFIDNDGIHFIYSKYVQCFEANSNREGSFIGGSYILHNTLAEESTLIRSLDDYIYDICDTNLGLGNRISKTIRKSEDLSCKRKPKDFERIPKRFDDRLVNKIQSQQKNPTRSFIIVDYSSQNNSEINTIISQSLILLQHYDTIYFINSLETLKYARRQGVYPVISHKEVEQKIKQIETDQIRQILDFKNSISSTLNHYKKRQSIEFRKLEEKKENCKKANERNNLLIQTLDDGIQKIEQSFNSYKKKLEDIILALENNKDISNAKRSIEKVESEYLKDFQHTLFDLGSLRPEEVSQPSNSRRSVNTPHLEKSRKSQNINDPIIPQNKPSKKGSILSRVFPFLIALILGIAIGGGSLYIYKRYSSKKYSCKECKTLKSTIKTLKHENKQLKKEEEAPQNYTEYTVKSRDNLSKLAKNFKTSEEELKKLNEKEWKGRVQNRLLIAGKKIKVPRSKEKDK